MAIGDEFSESAKAAQEGAKAVQEVAKTTTEGLKLTEKFGGFVSRLIGEPLDEAVGILTDRLKYSRWERRERLKDRVNQFIKERNIEGELRPVPPKIALPIMENASLEDNDELQDLWARLIASSVDPNFDGSLRTAFIDVLKQLEVNDVHILNFVYSYYEPYNERLRIKSRRHYGKTKNLEGHRHPVAMMSIISKLKIDKEIYKESIDNLIRVRCIAPYISEGKVKIPVHNRRKISAEDEFAIVSGFTSNKTESLKFDGMNTYGRVCITPLGVSFARACMLPKPKDSNQPE